MALSNFPYMFGQYTIPFPIDFDDEYTDVESVNQSEGGRDIVQNFRHGKFSASVSFSVADEEWVKKMETLYNSSSFSVFFYSPLLENYDERICRMRGFKKKRRKASELLPEVVGVWDISFTLEEF